MATMDDLELLKAALAVAVADGEIRRSQKGVVEGLAQRVGVGRASLQAMTEAAECDDSFADNILIGSAEKAHAAFELLVAEAEIDGEICDEERSVLVRIAGRLGITGDAFQAAYASGIEQADRIRKSRQ